MTRKSDLLNYALIPAAAIPVARVGGEPTVLVFLVIAAVLFARKRY